MINISFNDNNDIDNEALVSQCWQIDDKVIGVSQQTGRSRGHRVYKYNTKSQRV